MTIIVESNPSQQRLMQLKVASWPIWQKEVSSFPWVYDMEEFCYILEGIVTVTPTNGAAVELNAGDLVIFPAGLECTWKISENLRKHYQFN